MIPFDATLLAFIEGLEILVPVVAVIIWILSQVFSAGKANQKKRQRPPAQGQGDAGGAQVGQGGGGLRDEIEAFLKQVNQQQQPPEQPQQQADWQAQQAPREPEVVQAELVEPVRPLAAQSEPEPQRKKPTRPRRKKQKRSDVDRFAARTSQLGAEVDQADEKIQEHLEEVFDHQLGTLADTSDAIHEKPESSAAQPEAAGVAIPTLAADIREMMSSPDSVRKAFVLSEILNRREEPL